MVIRMRTAFIAAALAAACLQTLSLAQPPERDAVPVYDATEVAFDRYTVISRLSMGWSSAFWVPGHSTMGDARRALVAEAAGMGADGVVNLVCMSRTDGLLVSSGYYCYGNAIKVK